VAFYRPDGRLEVSKRLPVDIVGGERAVFDESIPGGYAGYTCKIFAWDITCLPLCDAETIPPVQTAARPMDAALSDKVYPFV
jgi:hypothetical protein